jgi:branched-subunit amino acid ABC-type transport system permease component
MLDLLFAHQVAISRVLSMVGATATVVIFESVFDLPWFIAIPAGAVAYLTMPALWAELLRFLTRPTRRREDPPAGP